ncbi:hypothetical protein RclHR1_25030001 [Rhizophagus clarus]|uniref:Uncharacterized protein n=1 Tax=Rhizophagus clarus TaxID=94130 RepID=A0A2Z6QZ33_9GLOM|nr:hypothetical protein RclHR1_25030001 [Rhizophagus clarus]
MSKLHKDMRDALRRDLFWNLARLPQESQLDIEKTFESQKDLVKKRRRLKTIAKLKNLKDPLIKQFKDEELLPIVRDNGYHSPEFSSEDEVDEKNKIIVRNLRWRSSTLR